MAISASVVRAMAMVDVRQRALSANAWARF